MSEETTAAEPFAGEQESESSVGGLIVLGVILVVAAFGLYGLGVDQLGGWVNRVPFIVGLGHFRPCAPPQVEDRDARRKREIRIFSEDVRLPGHARGRERVSGSPANDVQGDSQNRR